MKVGIRCPDVVASPVIWATQDGYQPRTIVFFVANAETDLTNVRQYVWNFGDGTTGSSRDDGISHDCTGDLLRDRLYANFDVQIDAHDARGLVATATRTIAVLTPSNVKVESPNAITASRDIEPNDAMWAPVDAVTRHE